MAGRVVPACRSFQENWASLLNPLSKWRGCNAPDPARPTLRGALTASVGGMLAIGVIGALAAITGWPLVLGSFGATVILVFCLPDSPVAQPRSILGGHLISTLISLLCLHLLGSTWWAMTLAMGATTCLMMLTGTLHPPGGANTIIVFALKPSWSFLFVPILLGAVIILVIALLFNNATRPERYPRYW